MNSPHGSLSHKKPNEEVVGKKTGSKKKSIENTSPTPLSFFYMCILYVFKKLVFPPIHVKIGIYMFALLICSFMKDFNLVHNRFGIYLANKKNIFNVYFVKFGWAWTLIIMTPFILMTSLVYTGGNKALVQKNLTRLIVGTFVWYVSTTVFDIIDSKTGICMEPSIRTKFECRSSKNEWHGFDISGHTFILMFSLFLMIEEVKVFINWENLRKKIDEMTNKEVKPLELTENGYERAQYWLKRLTPYIKINFCLMGVLALIWEMMLLSTFLFFHTIMQKLLASFVALIAWFLTYKYWYANKNMLLSPGLPGNGIEKLSSN